MIPETTIGPVTWIQRLWYGLFRLFGWRYVGDLPSGSRYVIVVAPHTSNWDFIHAFIASRACPLPFPQWVGKHTLFRGPLGALLRRMGGIPLNRTASHNFVHQVTDEFIRREQLILALAPEGTRSYTEFWKSGFYYIALDAQVPLYLVALDYKHRLVAISPTIDLSGDREVDMAQVQEFYARYGHGKNPEKQGPVRLRPRINKAQASNDSLQTSQSQA